MTPQQEKKQQRIDHLERKLQADTITSWEVAEQLKLYYELHPEEIYWDDGRTPAQIWGTWAQLREWVRRLFSGWNGEALRFALVLGAILVLIGLMSVIH